MALPGQVNAHRRPLCPTDVLAGVHGNFPFDPNGGHGYVWHCHIIDHEDNEMMRPLAVAPKQGSTDQSPGRRLLTSYRCHEFFEGRSKERPFFLIPPSSPRTARPCLCSSLRNNPSAASASWKVEEEVFD